MRSRPVGKTGVGAHDELSIAARSEVSEVVAAEVVVAHDDDAHDVHVPRPVAVPVDVCGIQLKADARRGHANHRHVLPGTHPRRVACSLGNVIDPDGPVH
jgi:hypothetical protein